MLLRQHSGVVKEKIWVSKCDFIDNFNVQYFCLMHRILETFNAFRDCDEISEKAIECLKDLEQIKMSHSIALWKLAVQIKKGIKNTRSMWSEAVGVH